MTNIPFGKKLKDDIFEAVGLRRVIPNWVSRMEGYDIEAVALFNEEASSVVGVRINPDGSASTIDQ